MIRNSDVIFSKTAAAFNFISKEVARRCVKEVAALHALGIDKRLPVLLYEQGSLSKDQVYAIMYSMLLNKQIKKIRNLVAYRFDEEDDNEFIKNIKVDPNILKQALLKKGELDKKGISKEVEEILTQDYGCIFTPDKLSYCVDIQQKLGEDGFDKKLLSITADKGWLTPELEALVPGIEDKKTVLTDSEERDPSQIRKNIGVLFGQLAVEKANIDREEIDSAISIWEKTASFGLKFRFSEILFYMQLSDLPQLLSIAELLKKLSNIDQSPRIDECHFDGEEDKLFQEILDKKFFPDQKVEKCRKLEESLKNIGLSVNLSDIFLIKGYFQKESLIDQWKEVVSKETVKAPEEEKKISQKIESARIHRNLRRTQTVELQRIVREDVKNQLMETSALEIELAKEYETVCVGREEEIKKDLQKLKKSMRNANKAEQQKIKAKLRYYERRKEFTLNHLAVIAASFLFVIGIFTVYAVINASPRPQKPPQVIQTPTKQDAGNSVPTTKPDANTQAQQEVTIEKAEEEFKKYQFAKSIQTLEQLLGKLTNKEDQIKVSKQLESFRQQYGLFQRLVQIIQSRKDETIDLYQNIFKKMPQILEADEDILVLKVEDIERFPIPWNKVKYEDLLRLFEYFGLSEEDPYTLAKMAYHLGFPNLAETYLIVQEKNRPSEKYKVDKTYAEMNCVEVPPGGFEVYEGHLIPSLEKERILSEERERLAKAMEETRKLKDENVAKEEAEKIARQREHEDFPRQFEAINEFVRTYEYKKAIDQFKEFKNTLYSTALKNKLDQRIEEIQPMAGLFDQLVKDINEKKLLDSEYKFKEDLVGQIAEADYENVLIKIPGGESRQKWCYLSPDKMANFFLRLNVADDGMFLIGCFCFDNGLLPSANKIFIELLKSQKIKPKLDAYLAKKLDIPVPEGGFVPYNGVLVSANEKEMRSKGYVKYNGNWVSSEEKSKLESGYVKYKGQWVTQSEKDLLNKGFVKFKGKWYNQTELNEIRSQWENAWETTTTHYNIRTNIGEDFMKEVALFIEAAYAEYYKFFGKKASQRMILYVFRTYDDYRNYCLQIGQPMHLKAGGFACNTNMTAVGWARGGDTRQVLETVIHEGAHLYHFNCAPRGKYESWYAEGIATQFEGYTWNGKNLSMNYVSKHRLSWLKRSLLEGKTFPLKEILEGKALDYINKGVDDGVTYYAQCWGLFYFLTHAPDKKVKLKFQTFFDDMNVGAVSVINSPSPFLSTFEQNINDIESNMKDFILALN